MHNSVAFYTSIMLYSHTYLVPKHFSISLPQNKAPYQLREQPVTVPSFFQLLVMSSLLSVCIDLPILDIPCKWNHSACDLLWLVHSPFGYCVFGHLCIRICFSTCCQFEGMYPGMELLGPMVILCLTFCGTMKLSY